MGFKVGDRVSLREDSVWDNGLQTNPIGVVGRVKHVHELLQ